MKPGKGDATLGLSTPMQAKNWEKAIVKGILWHAVSKPQTLNTFKAIVKGILWHSSTPKTCDSRDLEPLTLNPKPQTLNPKT
jgi:hypothetical protein